MIRLASVILVLGIFLCPQTLAFADLGPPKGWHRVGMCASFTGLSGQEQVALMAEVRRINGSRQRYLVKDGECLAKGYKFNKLFLYVVPRKLLRQAGIDGLKLGDVPSLQPVALSIETRYGDVGPDNPLVKVRRWYRLAGVKDGNPVAYLAREERLFNDGRPPQVRTWSAPGDSTR